MNDEPRPGEGRPAAGVTRRDLLRQGLLLGVATLARPGIGAAAEEPGPAEAGSALLALKQVEFDFVLNGEPVHTSAAARTTLLDLLRENLSHPGTKKGCDHGQCGACTVHIDGRRCLSCLTLAATVAGKNVTTIEGLADHGHLHPLQSSFIAHDAFQCGYCTPGQIMSAAAFLQEPWPKGDDAIREGMSGNICRCGAYCGIVAAIAAVRHADQSHSA